MRQMTDFLDADRVPDASRTAFVCCGDQSAVRTVNDSGQPIRMPKGFGTNLAGFQVVDSSFAELFSDYNAFAVRAKLAVIDPPAVKPQVSQFRALREN